MQNQFTEEEVTAAKATKEMIIRENMSELKSIYMAGEICMWDELKNATNAKEQSILFAEWTEKQDYTLVFETDLWGTIGNPKNYTTEELYELYLKSI